jgi:ATP-dependent DNA ligase
MAIPVELPSDATAPFLPMEAKLAPELPHGPGWQFEPKWDGFRCLAVRREGRVALFAKSGKGLTRFFPEMVEALAAAGTENFILDGELVIPVGESLDFDALQMRLHPAESRIRKLARETPARYIVFDLLRRGDSELSEQPLSARRDALEAFVASLHASPALRLSPFTRDRAEAQRWLGKTGAALDGVVAKRVDDRYHPGERAMIKVKPIRTADCVVGGFRYGTGSRQVGSLLLGLYDAEGRLNHVGFTSGIAAAKRQELTQRLESIRGGPGFTGNAPGGPSRWSTERSAEWVPLEPRLVVEVAYDQVTANRFRHGTRLVRWRPDKAPSQCTFDQLQREARPSRLIRELLA